MNTAGGVTLPERMSSASRITPDAVLFRKISHGADESRTRLPQFGAAVRFGVVPDHGAVTRPSRLFKRAQRPQRARVRRGAHQHPLRPGRPQMLADALERGAELAVAIDMNDPGVVQVAQNFMYSRQHPADPRLRYRPGTRQLDHEDFFHRKVPVANRPAAQVASADQPCLVIVGAEIRGTRMRNVDRDHRNARLQESPGNGRSDRFVRLKLDGKVDLLADQLLGVAQRDLGVVPVVQDHQFHVGSFGGAYQPGGDFPRKRGVLTVRGIADPEAACGTNFGNHTVAVLPHLLEEAAGMQGVQKAEALPLLKAGARYHVAQPQHFPLRAEGRQDLRGVYHGLNHVPALVGAVRHRTPLFRPL